MTHISVGFLAAFCVVLVTVASTSIEIYDGTYYGIEDVNGVTAVQVSTPDDGSQRPDDRIPPPPGHHRGHHGRGHHGRGHHGRGRLGDDAPDGRHGGPHHYERGPAMHANLMTNWTEEQKLNHVCEHIQQHNSQGRHHHGGMLESRLQNLVESDRQKIVELWNARKQEMLRCCGMDSIDQKMKCANDIQAARYDRVCRGEEPLCPWAQFMPQRNRHGHGRGHHFTESSPSTSNTTTVCCAREGSERLQCFADAKQKYQQQRAENWHGRAMPPPSRPGDRRNERPNERGDERSSRRGGRRQRPVGTTPSV